MASERLHGLLAGLDVHEHTLQLARKLEPALSLELAEHGVLCIVVRDTPDQQPFAEMLLVVPLEQVLILQIPARWKAGSVLVSLRCWCQSTGGAGSRAPRTCFNLQGCLPCFYISEIQC